MNLEYVIVKIWRRNASEKCSNYQQNGVSNERSNW